MGKYFYRFDDSCQLGHEMRSFWHDADKATAAAERWAKKFGGEGAVYYEDPNNFAGGVRYLSFPREADVNREMWRYECQVGEDDCYVPNCKQRSDAIWVQQRGFMPSDTSARKYQKHYSTWKQVKGIYTTEEWAEIAGITLTGEQEQDDALVSRQMASERFVEYTEFYGEIAPKDKRYKSSKYVSRAIEAEVQRLSLPVVKTQRLYEMLHAHIPNGLLSQITPTFFYYGGRYYISLDYECTHRSLENISAEMYQMKREQAILDERLRAEAEAEED